VLHERVKVVVAARGYDQAACFLGRDDVGVWAEDLVAPDVVVVIMAVDDDVDRATGEGLGCGARSSAACGVKKVS